MTFSSGNSCCGEYGPASHTNRKPPDTEAEDADSDPGHRDACERSVDVFLYRVHGERVPVRVPVHVVVVVVVAVSRLSTPLCGQIWTTAVLCLMSPCA